jgi:hypothetical protein
MDDHDVAGEQPMNFLKARDPKRQSTTDLNGPEKLPTRWVIILALAMALGLLVGKESASVAAGIGAGVLLAGFLHNVMP